MTLKNLSGCRTLNLRAKFVIAEDLRSRKTIKFRHVVPSVRSQLRHLGWTLQLLLNETENQFQCMTAS